MESGRAAPGIYRINSKARPKAFQREVVAKGWRWFFLDGTKVANKGGFLHAAANAMAFPNYFGLNWDAFEEMVNDLSWVPAPGYILFYDHAGNFAKSQPDEWKMALTIFGDAVESWTARGIPLFILLQGLGTRESNLPALILGPESE